MVGISGRGRDVRPPLNGASLEIHRTFTPVLERQVEALLTLLGHSPGLAQDRACRDTPTAGKSNELVPEEDDRDRHG